MKKNGLLVVALVIGMAVFSMSVEHSARAATEVPATSTVPAPLKAIGESAEHAFEMIYAHKSGKTLHDIAALHKNATRLEGKLSSDKIDGLYDSITALEKALSANDRHAALLTSNRITSQVAEATRSYHPTMPVEVVLLDYNGRELQLWAEADDLSKLKETTKNIQALWQSLIPDLQKRQANTVIKTFGTLVDRLSHADTVHEYAVLANPLLERVDDIEKVYGE